MVVLEVTSTFVRPRYAGSSRCFRRLLSHMPVMANEIVQLMRPDHGKVFIDMTFGAGGHTRRLLGTNKDITVVAVDRDPVAYREAQKLAAEVAIKSSRLNVKQTVIPVHGKFSEVMRKINLCGISYGSVNGILFDLGASSMQYDDPSRGFALSSDGPLDMRMDTSNNSDITASDVVNNLSQEDLAFIIKTYGEERRSRRISSAIVDARTLLGRIKTTQELVTVISKSVPSGLDALGNFAHGGTRLFQALRIFVNNELNELNYAIEKMRDFLIPSQVIKTENREEIIKEPYGIAAVLTFHSLEDRIVKRHFSEVDTDEPEFKHLSQQDRIRTNMLTDMNQIRELAEHKLWYPVGKHVTRPTDIEMSANPRSRSAKLRAALRLMPA